MQEGCDKFCTYCVVPYTRGAEVSRPWGAVLDEAKALVDAGAREITLLGQNVNAWAGEDEAGAAQGLDGLIRALDRIPGIARIRYMTSHPNDMRDGLIAAHGEVASLMPFLHLPVQAGSDRILKAMNRSHTAASYLRVIERVRAVRPDIAISGDFIVGFPGETEADFAATLALVERGRPRAGVQLQIFAPPRHARRDDGRSGAAGGDGRAAAAAAGADRRAGARLQPRERGADDAGADRARRQAAGPAARQIALAAIGAGRQRRAASARCSMSRSSRGGPNSLQGVVARRGGRLIVRRRGRDRNCRCAYCPVAPRTRHLGAGESRIVRVTR